MSSLHYYSIKGSSIAEVVASLLPGSMSLASTTANHELWHTCPICSRPYDARSWDACPDCLDEDIAPASLLNHKQWKKNYL